MLKDGCNEKASTVLYSTGLDRVISKHVRAVLDADETVPFHEAARRISEQFRNSIVGDAVVYAKISVAEVLELLRVHFFSHVVRFPNSSIDNATTAVSTLIENANTNASCSNLLTQVHGIPQGSVLSPLLCNFYYGNAEGNLFGTREEIKLLGLSSQSVILRMMDDYLMISTSKSCVQHFLQRSQQCLKPYGGGVNPKKTRVNFQTTLEIDGQCVPLTKIGDGVVPWCGLLLDERTLEFRPGFSRLTDSHLINSVVVELQKHGKGLKHAMKSFVRMKCHAIVLDSAVTRKCVVVQSLYSMLLVAAMRTCCYLSKLRHYQIRIRSQYVFCCVQETLLFAARLIHSRTKQKTSKRLQLNPHNGRDVSKTDACSDSSATDSDDDNDIDNGKQHSQAHSNSNTVTDSMPEPANLQLSFIRRGPRRLQRYLRIDNDEDFGSCDMNHSEV